MEETDCRARLRVARVRVAENEAALLMVPVRHPDMRAALACVAKNEKALRLLQAGPADSLAALQTAREAVLAWGASE